MRQKLIALGLYVVIALPVFTIWVIVPGFRGFDRALTVDMIHGTAYRPYVMRALAPSLVRVTTTVISPQIDDAALRRRFEILLDLLRSAPGECYRSLAAWDRAHILEYLIATLICFSFLVAFALCLRALFRQVYATGSILATLVPAFALACLPLMFRAFGQLYDFPLLFFITLGYLALARGDMRLFYITYTVGLFNKETMVLLALLFWLMHRKDAARTKWRRRHLAVMGAVFLAIRIVLTAAFRGNPGHNFEFHMARNITYLLSQPYEYYQFAGAGLIALAIFYKWLEKPVLLRKAMSLAVVLIAMTAVFGFLDEFRDYYEVYPIACLLIAHSVCRVLDIPMKTADGGAV